MPTIDHCMGLSKPAAEYTQDDITKLIDRALTATAQRCSPFAVEELGFLARALLFQFQQNKFAEPKYTPLSTYLDMPHARNVHGTRIVSDLCYDEVKNLSRDDLLTVSQVALSILETAKLETAQAVAEKYQAQAHYHQALAANAERDVKIAKMRHQGVASDMEP